MLAGVLADVTVCRSIEAAIHAAASARFDVVFFALREHSATTLALLQLLRRTMPRTPVVLMLDEATTDAHRATLEMRPFYVAVSPVSPDELGTVFENAVAAARRAS